MEPATAAAWHALEPHLALDAHTHRFVAERDGAAVGAGLLHTHHGVGLLRAGTVLHYYRGLGIQRRLLTGRMEHARRLGCDLVGASADEGSVSQANLERVGLRPVARRARYRVVASTA